MTLTDHTYYKNLSACATIICLIPLIYKMTTNINVKNFCNYLALISFVAFNFGYHVHEKAILMVYIPMIIGCRTHIDKARVEMLGIGMMWSFVPIIPFEFEGAIKNLLLLAQIIQLAVCIPNNHIVQVKNDETTL